MKPEEKIIENELAPTVLKWEKVLKMYEKYANNSRRFMINIPGKGLKTLTGLNVPISIVNKIMSLQNAHHIYFCFATPLDQVTRPYDQREITVIVCGMNAMNEAIIDPNAPVLYKYSLADFLNPCPETCPQNKPHFDALDSGIELPFHLKDRKAESFVDPVPGDPVTLEDAKKMQKAYATAHIEKVLRFPGPVEDRIYGFWLDNQTILDIRALGTPTAPLSEIFLLFATSSSTKYAHPLNQQFTLIPCAVDSAGNDIKDCNIITTDVIFDEMEVCSAHSDRIPDIFPI